MSESTLERIKRLNSESKQAVFEVPDDCWRRVTMAILFACDESLVCTPKQLTDFQIGVMVGEVFHKTISQKQKGKND